jgi:ABC-type Mn2+/Zn2+ transport system permease subunit
MIDSFISSWALFHNTYIAGWLIGLCLALVGVLVVAKDQIFIGAAISQASTFGLAVAIWAGSAAGGTLGEWLQSDGALSGMSVMFSVIAALATTFAAREGSRESHEAVTGWIFLLSSSAAILVVTRSPHGLEEVHRLMSSTIIGATTADVYIFGGLLMVSILVLLAYRRLILLLVLDPGTAAALGIRTRLWSVALAVWLGLTIGLSIRISGMLYTFGFLVLPALVAKNLCREVSFMFIVAPLLALLAGVTAFVFANHWDFPPGQMAVATMAALLPFAWIIRVSRFR